MSSGDELPLFKTAPPTSTSPASNFPNDPWLASSALQKSIRRGDTEVATAAATTLYMLRGSSIWARLLVIAFEDIGAAAPDALVEIVNASSNPAWRRLAGGNANAVQLIARMAARAAKDRSADHLICCARSHPSLADTRERLASASIGKRIGMALDDALPITERAAAAWYASGVEWGRETRVGPGDLDGLLSTFGKAGVPEPLLDAVRIGARRTREPITIMLPVLWLAVKADRRAQVVECPVPAAPTIAGVPLYAMDTHTRTGKAAIGQFAKENDVVRAALEQHVPMQFRRQAAYLAAFYADAAPVALKLQWSQSEDIERLGIQNDIMSVGAAPEAVPALLGAVRDNLGHLNAIREEVLSAALRDGSIGGQR